MEVQLLPIIYRRQPLPAFYSKIKFEFDGKTSDLQNSGFVKGEGILALTLESIHYHCKCPV